jgi:hypothetical protein
MTQQYITEEGQNFQYNVPQFPHQAPKTPITKRRWFLPVAVAVGVLAGSLATGAVSASAAAAKTANCKVAFEHADTAFGSASKVIGYLGDGLQDAARLDSDAIRELGPKIDTETEKMKSVTDEYNKARDLCEG